MVAFKNDIEQSVTVLKAGGIVLYPTDTIWGLGCDATNAEAVAKIYRLKKRSDEKAMIVLMAQERDILEHVAALDLSIFTYLQKSQKPTTVIYEHAIGFAENLVGKDGTIGIRLCKNDFCTTLINRLKKPLVSTSANISGNKHPRNFSEIDEEIKKGVDYIVHYRQSEVKMAEPSTILKWKNGAPQILRF